MNFCDLHTHSTFSDGSNTPAEIVAMAKELNIAVALTDHNTVSGLTEFLSEAERLSVTAVAGTELSTMCANVELHLLGLFISPENFHRVERLVKEFLVMKQISNLELIERLNAAGYEIEYSDVKKRNPTENINRAHIAAELRDKGYVSSITEAFNTVLHEDAGFYVPPPRLDLFDAIRFLREIDAVPILAHPLQELSSEELRAIIPEAIEAGLLGIEVFHSSYSEEQIASAIAICEEYGLLKSGGSDFHGSNKPDISIAVGKGNLSIPIRFYNEIKKAKEAL